jgi:hypothetical protein
MEEEVISGKPVNIFAVLDEIEKTIVNPKSSIENSPCPP